MKLLHVVGAAQVVGTVAILGLVAMRGSSETPPEEGEKPAAVAQAEGAAAGEGAEPTDAHAHPASAPAGHGAAPAAKPHGDGHGAEAAPATAGMDAVADLLAGNGRFAKGLTKGHDWLEERSQVAKGQQPKVMVLACSDSRVAPELLFDRGLGEVFVVRNAGNVAEPVGVASLEYAAEHLGSKVLVVLGHEKCGAVTAAAKGGKLPSKNLETLVGRIAPALVEVKKWAKGDELVHLGVEANVANSAKEVLRQSPILQHKVSEGELTILRAVYDLESGRVRPVP